MGIKTKEMINNYMKHTKGKWVEKNNSIYCKRYKIADICNLTSQIVDTKIDGETFGQRCNRIGIIRNRLKKERVANAILISAAPELLTALIKMCDFHEKNATWDKGNNGYYEAKRIIKKATE